MKLVRSAPRRFFLLVVAASLLFAGSLPFTDLYAGARVDTEKITKEWIESGGKKRTYYLFLPKNLPANQPAPLLVTFHGSGRNGASLIELWRAMAAKEGIIVAGPDSDNPSEWFVPKDGPDFVRDLIETLKSKYPVDPRRVYLFGHSAGATFALSISLLESEYFAATAAHAGAIEPDRYWLLDYARRKIPFALFVGTDDPYFPLAKVRATRDTLSSREFPVELTEIPRHTHDYYSRAPEINKNVWNFLSSKRLEGNPQYTPHRFRNE